MQTLYSLILSKKHRINYVVALVTLLLTPSNLGLHFVTEDAYINGMLVDYLIPTLYLQEILIAVFLIINIGVIKQQLKKADSYLIWFLFSLFISSLLSAFLLASLTMALKIFLYALFGSVLFAVFQKKEAARIIVNALGISVFFLSLLGIAQWFSQSSIFNNYLVLGEQPYTASTSGVNTEYFFGVRKVPSYGTFLHPNIFGGYLSLALIVLIANLREKKILGLPIVLGITALFFTLSYFSWVSFLIGLVMLAALLSSKKVLLKTTLLVVITISLVALYLPLVASLADGHLDKLTQSPSFYRRADLMNSSYELVKDSPLYGSGLGTASAYIETYLPTPHDLRLSQPPHNIFVLLFQEAGIFTVVFFVLLFVKKTFAAEERNKIALILLAQLLFLGSFDHYLITMPQTGILMWLIIAAV